MKYDIRIIHICESAAMQGNLDTLTPISQCDWFPVSGVESWRRERRLALEHQISFHWTLNISCSKSYSRNPDGLLKWKSYMSITHTPPFTQRDKFQEWCLDHVSGHTRHVVYVTSSLWDTAAQNTGCYYDYDDAKSYYNNVECDKGRRKFDCISIGIFHPYIDTLTHLTAEINIFTIYMSEVAILY